MIVIVLMDTSYWGTEFGGVLFKDSIMGGNLLIYYVNYEINELYKKRIAELELEGLKSLR